MGGFCGGGGSQLETRSTGSASGTQTRGSSPRPKPRPDTSSTTYKVKNAVSTAASNLVRDVSMGATTFGKSEAAGNAALSAAGYSQKVIKDYRDRTAATIERNRKAEAEAAAMREQGRSSEDQNRGMLDSRSGVSGIVNRPEAIAGYTNMPSFPTFEGGTPTGATPAAGPAETKVVEDAKKKTGFAGTIETTPQGLMTEAKTRKKRSLMGGLIS